MKQKTLLVVDVQNEFCHPNGFFARNLCECNPEGFFGPDKLTPKRINETVSNIERAITHFREQGSPVVHIKAVSNPEFLSASRFERYKSMYEQGFLKDGTWSTEFYRVAPLREERVFKKGAYNPFQNEEFKDHIVRTTSGLILAGFFSDVCIDAIARTADEKDIGIPTEIIADCSTGLLRPHEENLRFMEMFYGTTIHKSLQDYVTVQDKGREFYNRLIGYISQGDIELEIEARDTARKFDLPLTELEEAIKTGESHSRRGVSTYGCVLLHIGAGDLELEQAGRRLAKKYNLITTDLELALTVGRRASTYST